MTYTPEGYTNWLGRMGDALASQAAIFRVAIRRPDPLQRPSRALQFWKLGFLLAAGGFVTIIALLVLNVAPEGKALIYWVPYAITMTGAGICGLASSSITLPEPDPTSRQGLRRQRREEERARRSKKR